MVSLFYFAIIFFSHSVILDLLPMVRFFKETTSRLGKILEIIREMVSLNPDASPRQEKDVWE